MKEFMMHASLNHCCYENVRNMDKYRVSSKIYVFQLIIRTLGGVLGVCNFPTHAQYYTRILVQLYQISTTLDRNLFNNSKHLFPTHSQFFIN